MKLLEGKVALITGGTRGIGEAIVKKFAEAGAHVVFTYIASHQKAATVEQQVRQYGTRVASYQSDAASYAACEQLVERIMEDFQRIDVLVNNAAITRDNLLLRMTEQHWDEVLATNLKSVFNLCKHVAKPMMKHRCGSIINIGSIVGLTGNAGQTNYSAAKAGLVGFTKSLAKELGSRNIRCNLVAPGFIETEMTQQLSEQIREQYKKNVPLGRYGTPEEVANVCLFLASDLSSYVNGQVLSVCGGWYA